MESDIDGLDPLSPLTGWALYARREPEYADLRGTQLLSIAIFLGGDERQISQISPVADALGVPQPRTVAKSSLTRSLSWVEDAALGRLEMRRIFRRESLDEEMSRALIDVRETAAPSWRLWENIRLLHSSRAALALLYRALDDPNEKVKVVAAAALRAIHPLGNERVDAVLAEAMKSEDETAAAVACAALRIAAAPEQFVYNSQGSAAASRLETNSGRPMSMIVHGTFARLASKSHRWYDPTAALPQRILKEASPDLYVGTDYFRWDGGFNENARKQGGANLIEWCRAFGVREIDTLYAHSHGGNVAMNAIAAGLKVRLLVLLHVPILSRSSTEWKTIDNNVGRVLDLRTYLDWVVAVDGLISHSRNGFRGELSNVEQPTTSIPRHLDISHFRYVQDEVWADLNLPSEVCAQRVYISAPHSR